MKIVLAYSGGLDTSVIIKWLKEKYGAEIIAYTANIGQNINPDELREKALKTGAEKFYFEDLREEFVNEFILPALKALTLLIPRENEIASRMFDFPLPLGPVTTVNPLWNIILAFLKDLNP